MEGQWEEIVVDVDDEVVVDENDLFESAMQGQWDKVEQVYKEKPHLQKAIITKSEDTALHIAVSNGATDYVLKLVESLGENLQEVLKIKNKKGNTALHLAASLGNVDICQCIASTAPDLIASQNRQSETPLFLAACHGKYDAFLCLNSLGKQNNTSCRKSDKDTILHVALSGEYFKLAFQIIQYYPDLVNSEDKNGITPLHILASKPNAFYSSSHLKPFDRLIYHGIIVDKLVKETYDQKACSSTPGDKTFSNYPKNYETCMTLIKTSIRGLTILVGINTNEKSDKAEGNSEDQAYPPNCGTFALFLSLMMKALLIILGVGISKINKIVEKKERHCWANQIMDELVGRTSSYKYADTERNRQNYNLNANSTGMKESPLLIAAKMGAAEIVEKILDKFPVAAQDSNNENKNVVLLAVENRQTSIYQLLLKRSGLGESVFRQTDKQGTVLKRNGLGESVFRQTDNQGNSALHLAARCGDYRPWLIPGGALQMQWEIKWFKFVKRSIPQHVFVRSNKNGQTAKEIFKKTHKELVGEGRDWLTKTAEACSVVAALIATVAYTTSATVPGGIDQQSGKPVLAHEVPFTVFAISSILALCFSVTALVFFLSILTSRFQEHDFEMDLPRKLLLGLTSLFASIASILISFCSGHFFILKENLRSTAYPIYVVTCLPMTYFALAQLPLYLDLIQAIFKKVPQRSYKVISH